MKYSTLVQFDLEVEPLSGSLQRQDAFHFVNRALLMHNTNVEGIKFTESPWGNSVVGNIEREGRDSQSALYSLSNGFVVVKHSREMTRSQFATRDALYTEFRGHLQVYAESSSACCVDRIDKYVCQKIKKRFKDARRV